MGFEQIHHGLEDRELYGLQGHFTFWRLALNSERRGAEGAEDTYDGKEYCMLCFHSVVLGHSSFWAIEAFILGQTTVRRPGRKHYSRRFSCFFLNAPPLDGLLIALTCGRSGS